MEFNSGFKGLMEQGTPLDRFIRSAAEGIPQLACSLPYSKETGTDTNSVKRIIIHFTAQYFCFFSLFFWHDNSQ